MKYTKLSPSGKADRAGGGWLPWSIQPSFLAFFIFLCLFFSLIIEILGRRSKRLGALAYAEPDAEFSLGTICLFNYFPTFIAAAFGLLWALSDHNFKRLEPYFQLSKQGGALAEDSLLLDYPYISVFLVPYFAFKRSHWPVFYSSTISILISFVIIPLMSGVLEQTTLPRAINSSVLSPTLLLEHENFTSTQFTYTLGDYVWLNGTVPAFTSETYTILPFLIGTGTYPKNETWVGETVLFEADLDCTEAERKTKGSWSEFSNGKDCIASTDNSEQGLCDEIGNMGQWFTCFFNPMSLASSISNSSLCPNTHAFLTAFGGQRNNNSLTNNYTTLFCESSYWSQPVKATIQMPAGIIQGIERLGNRSRFENFDITNFVSIVTRGQILSRPEGTDQLGNPVNFGYPPCLNPDPRFRLDEDFGTGGDGYTYLSVIWTRQKNSITNLVLAGESNNTIARLLDPIELGKTYTTAFKLYFAYAIASEITNTKHTLPANVTRMFETRTYIANRHWSTLCQTGFGLLVILTICLIVSTTGRQCNIDGEPNSIAASLMRISHGSAFTISMSNAEYCNPHELRELLTRDTYHFQLHNSQEFGIGPRIEIFRGRDTAGQGDRILLANHTFVGPEDVNLSPYNEKVSWWLTKPMGILCFLYFSSLLIFLVFLYYCDKRYQGLPTVAPQNSFGYKLLFSYLPTIVGMSVEPLWAVLGVYCCMVGPYEALRQGGALSTNSLTLNYDDMPVLFQLLRSYRKRNLVLGALTTGILLANFLPVALGGLFSPTTISTQVPHNIESIRIPPNTSQVHYIANRWVPYSFTETFYVVAGFLTHNNKLSAWTTPDFYILPVEDTHAMKNASFLSRQVTTWGLGTDISCEFMPEDMVRVSRKQLQDIVIYTVDVNHPCLSTNDKYTPMSNTIFQSFNPVTDLLVPSLKCPGTFAVGWIERPANPEPKDTNSSYLDRIDHLILLCRSGLRLAELSVSVGPSDEVLHVDMVHSKNFTYKNRDPTDLVMYNSSIESMAGNLSELSSFESINPLFDFQFILSTQSNPQLNSSGQLNDPVYVNYINDIGTLWTSPQKLYWYNYLMATYEPGIQRQLTNFSYLPERSLLIKSFEYVYVALFAVHLQLNFDTIFSVDHFQKKQESINVNQNHVAISTAMFSVIVGILGFSIFVVFVFHSDPPGRHMSHLPTSIASTYTLLYASNILDSVSKITGKDFKERAAKLDKLGNKYSYGFFLGRDEGKHFGVYQELPPDQDPILTMGNARPTRYL